MMQGKRQFSWMAVNDGWTRNLTSEGLAIYSSDSDVAGEGLVL